MTMRTLIVDDEEWSRRRVAALRRPFTEVEVIRECASGAEAVEAISPWAGGDQALTLKDGTALP
jgi:DNA-binding NarL/FixJ family response regulator